MSDEWVPLAEWWLTSVADDPLFATDVLPLLDGLLPPRTGPWLELGCGEGRVLRHLRGDVAGCDVAFELLTRAGAAAPVVQCRLPDLAWLRPGALEGVLAVLVLEHIADLDRMLASAHRVVRPGGRLVVVANHPAFTAAGSGPVVDITDGEVLWRWGPYFHEEATSTDVGSRLVTFHHRPMERWLNAASDAGWTLEQVAERGLSEAAVLAVPGYAGQQELPRLVGWRWRR